MTFLLNSALLLFDKQIRNDAKDRSKVSANADPTVSSSSNAKKSSYNPNQTRSKDGRWVDTGKDSQKPSTPKIDLSKPDSVEWEKIDTTPEMRTDYNNRRLNDSNEQVSNFYKKALDKAKDSEMVKNGKVPVEEAAALINYTGNTYGDMNKSLRGQVNYNVMDTGTPDPTKSTTSRNIEDSVFATSALNKLPSHEGTVYRAVMLSTFAAKKGKAEIIASKYEVGKVVTEEGFTSTSLTTSNNFWKNAQIRYIINSKAGKNVEKVSMFPEEKEILFRPKTKFKVLSKEKQEDIVTIYMNEI